MHNHGPGKTANFRLRIDLFARKAHLACVSANVPPSRREAGSRPKRMVEERRKHPRTEINQLGYISAGGAVMRCLVLDISPQGAAVEVDNPAFVPQPFRPVMADQACAV